MTLAEWTRMARRLANPRRSAGAGIMVANRQDRPFPCGLFCYRRTSDPRHGLVLVADHFVGLDIVDPGAILQALVAELDALARRLRCGAVHSVVGEDWPELARSLSAVGHRQESTTFCKVLPETPFD